VLSKVLGGWRFATVAILQCGWSFSVYCSAPFKPVYQVPGDPTTPLVGNSGCDYNADGFAWDFPNQPSFGNSRSASRSDFLQGMFKASVSLRCLGPARQSGPKIRLTGQDIRNVNATFNKATSIPWFTSEGASLEIRAEIITLFNKSILGYQRVTWPVACSVIQRRRPPRAVQFGIRLSF
jgi:hypothetical protein